VQFCNESVERWHFVGSGSKSTDGDHAMEEVVRKPS